MQSQHNNSQNQRQAPDNKSNQMTSDIGEELGAKLTINPDLPAHMDFAGSNMLDTPNSFKGSGNTPTTPFGLSHLQFPTNILSQLSTYASQLPTPLPTQTPEQLANAAEELFNLMPKTPLFPGQLNNVNYSFATAASVLQKQQKQKHVPPKSSGLQTHAKTAIISPSSQFEETDSTRSAPVKARKKKTRQKRGRSNAKDESRWKSWTREEEVFLVGAVMDRFFKRGSLSSSKADDLTSDDSWSVIKKYYETAWKNYYLRTGISIPTERPANALSRHYKVMKARISQSDISGDGGEDFRTYFEEWEKVYNVDNCLVADLLRSRIKKDRRVKDYSKRKVRLSLSKNDQRPAVNYLTK